MYLAGPDKDKIKSFRVKHKLLIEDCAYMANVAFFTWQEWERGRKVMPAATWELLNLKACPGSQVYKSIRKQNNLRITKVGKCINCKHWEGDKDVIEARCGKLSLSKNDNNIGIEDSRKNGIVVYAYKPIHGIGYDFVTSPFFGCPNHLPTRKRK